MSLLDDDMKNNNSSLTNHICTNDSATIIAHLLDRDYIAKLLARPPKICRSLLPFDFRPRPPKRPSSSTLSQKSWKRLH